MTNDDTRSFDHELNRILVDQISDLSYSVFMNSTDMAKMLGNIVMFAVSDWIKDKGHDYDDRELFGALVLALGFLSWVIRGEGGRDQQLKEFEAMYAGSKRELLAKIGDPESADLSADAAQWLRNLKQQIETEAA